MNLEGLDPITSREMDRLILQVRDTLGTTMVIVSHQLSSIFRLADRVIMLDREPRELLPKALRRTGCRKHRPRVRDFLNQNEAFPKRTNQPSGGVLAHS